MSVTRTTSSGLTKAQKIGYAYWAVAAFILLAFLANIGATAPPAAAPNGARTVLATPSEDTLQKMALLINMGGELCARVLTIKRVHGDVYQVQCTRYRDGTGTASYEVNAATGAVK